MDAQLVLVLILAMVLVFLIYIKMVCSTKEGISGFGVTSGLAFNNRSRYCDEGIPGTSYSGGCFTPGRVII